MVPNLGSPRTALQEVDLELVGVPKRTIGVRRWTEFSL